MRGYKPGRFSFNVKGGRCEACQGDGLIKIEMHFLPDIYVQCEECKGRRYNRETLEILYRDQSIADVLAMTVDDAAELLQGGAGDTQQARKPCSGWASATSRWASRPPRFPAGRRSGSSSPRSCRGARRARPSTSWTSPPPALHFHDVRKLLEVLHALVESGNTVVVIEHNLEVIKTADWIVDLGP